MAADDRNAQAVGLSSTLTSSPSAVATRWSVVIVAPTPPDSSRSIAAWLVPMRRASSRWLSPADSRAS